MRYRIKIITYGSGRKEYYPQVKKFFGWVGLAGDGVVGYSYNVGDRESALRAIDRHFYDNSRKQTIEFKYITKQNIN